MTVYVLKYEQPGQGFTRISVWEKQIDAYKQACSEIQNTISSMDFESLTQTQIDNVITINDLVKSQDWREAVIYWNDSNLNNKDSDYVEYYDVQLKGIRNTSNVLEPVIFDSTFLETYIKPTNNMADTVNIADVAFVSDKPGANCRKCGKHSDYAYADCKEGTYLCAQCKIFMNIF